MRPLILCVSLTLCTAWISSHLVERYNRGTHASAVQETILLGPPGSYPPQWNNRVLFPAGQVALSRLTGWSARESFVALRYASIAVMFALFYAAASRLSRAPLAAEHATLALAIAFCFGFNHDLQNPVDALDVMAFTLATWFAVGGRLGRLLILACLASASRESSLFFGLIWAGAQVTRHSLRRLIAQCVAVTAAALAATLVLRYVFDGDAFVGPARRWGHAARSVIAFLQDPGPTDWIPLGAGMLAVAALPWLGRPHPREGWGLLAAGVVMGIVSALGATPMELRIFLPVVTVWMLAGILRGSSPMGVHDHGAPAPASSAAI